MTETDQDRLLRQTVVSIWWATRARMSLTWDALSSVSRTAVHYGCGAADMDIAQRDRINHDTIMIKAGIRLGLIQTVYNSDGDEEKLEDLA